MRLHHTGPIALLIKLMPQIFKKSHQRLIAQLQCCKNAVKISGKTVLAAPELAAFIFHIMFNFMPTLKKYGLQLYLESIINAHLPCFIRNLLFQIIRQTENAIDLHRLEFHFILLRLRPFHKGKHALHHLSAYS